MTENLKPPLILSLETSGDVCGVALLRGSEIVVEQTFSHKMHLSERLMDIVEGILLFGETTLDAIGAFAVGVGPGSFTGTRIGVMTAKVFAEVHNTPIFGINSLQALAQEYAGIQEAQIVPILPCRTGIVYANFYRVSGTVTESLGEIEAVTLENLVENLSQEFSTTVFCGQGVDRYQETLESLLNEQGKTAWFGTPRFPRVTVIGQLARARFEQNPEGDDVLALVPEYVAPPPISMPKRAFPTLPTP